MIQIKNLSKGYAHQVLFSEASLVLGEKEKIGVIGRNGTGKSTFFKLLLGEEGWDDGTIEIPEYFKIRSLEQNLNFEEKTLLEQVCVSLPQNIETEHWKAKSILMGLGFEEKDFTRSPFDFSSGYKVRIRLAQALVGEADMLLLDEPTNYLDIVSLRWLSNFLQNWKNAFVLITHNKNFMEEVVDCTVAIHRGKMRKMKGGPTKLLEHIAKDEEVYEQTRKNALQKQAKTEEFIRTFRAGARSAGLVQSRIKALEKQEIGTKLEYLPPIVFQFKPEIFRGNSLIELRNVCFHYPDSPNKTLIEKFHLEIEANQCVAIIGKNGKGKSTLLDLMGGILQKNSGHIKRYQTLKIGYFGDHLKRELHEENTIIAELMSVGNIKEQEARKMAASLLFTGNLAKKQIKYLSGGEKSRVCLGKVMLEKCHLLLLDEPSNHLDMESVQALITALKNFDGSIVFVSHDEQFLHELATRLVVFEEDKITVKEFGYQEFLNQGGWLEEQNLAPKKVKKTSEEKNNFLEKKELQKKLRKLKKDQEKLEKRNFEIEKKLGEISGEFQDACSGGDQEQIKILGEKIKSYNDEVVKNNEEIEDLLEAEIEIEEQLE
jgi:ATP-binding cassette subfamily F protein 3